MKTKIVDTKVVLSSILMLAIGFEMGGFQAVLREMGTHFSLGKVAMGILVSSQYVSIIIMPAIFGRIADRVGKKRVLLVFMSLFCIGCLFAGLSDYLWLTLFSFFLIGAGYGVAESVCTALLSDQYGENADRYMNFSQSFLCIGAILAPIFATLFLPAWRWVFLASAGICLVSFVLLALETSFILVPHLSSDSILDFSLFKKRLFVLLFISMILYVGLENGFGYFTESFFYDTHASSLGPLAIAVYWAFMALSRILSSMSGKEIYRQLLFRFIVIGGVMVGFLFSRHPYLSLALCAAIGFSYGPIWSYIMSSAAALYPDRSASTIGMISSGCGVGGALFPLVMGGFLNYGPAGSGFVFLAGSALLAAVCIIVALPHRDKENIR